MDIIEKFKQSLMEHKIAYEPLELDGKTYEFYFKERKLCLFIVNEEEYNEKTIDKKYFRTLMEKFHAAGLDLMMMYRSHFIIIAKMSFIKTKTRDLEFTWLQKRVN